MRKGLQSQPTLHLCKVEKQKLLNCLASIKIRPKFNASEIQVYWKMTLKLLWNLEKCSMFKSVLTYSTADQIHNSSYRNEAHTFLFELSNFTWFHVWPQLCAFPDVIMGWPGLSSFPQYFKSDLLHANRPIFCIWIPSYIKFWISNRTYDFQPNFWSKSAHRLMSCNLRQTSSH